MKHFMQPRNTTLLLREAETTPSSCSSPSPNPMTKQRSSPSPSSSRKHRGNENSNPNTVPDAMRHVAAAATAKIKSPLPPRPPSSLKRKLNLESVLENSSPPTACDSGVNVIVRMRPVNKDVEEGEKIVEKISNDSLSINGHTFTFDAIADTDSTQKDVFQLVGAPLVENCLAGFNSSVFAYGQTGSGKTYTMWGPANALLEGNLWSDQQGLTPRVFERLFARINEEQIKHADTQLTYQCRCSFLEIYNEQITDLLDPNQKNLQIREDVKSGVYVEGLTEASVSSMKDITENLVKGLSNRRTGATSINAESSRSHSVFTCVVESRRKRVGDGLSSFKTSRINLVDLAGSERQKSTGAGGERLKEAGNINRSLSQLGNLINILAEVSQTGKQRHIPYRDSRLTFLLQESLGGNAKLSMVCAISPSQSCKNETFSTLRFAQRAKAIKNKAVVNEIMQDDVKFLREVIRQLKDELLRVKANNGTSAGSGGGYSTGRDARRSLNLIKLSLSRPLTLRHVDDDGDEVMEIDESCIEKMLADPRLKVKENACIMEQIPEDADVNMEEGSSDQVERNEDMIVDSEQDTPKAPEPDCSVENHDNQVEGNEEDQACVRRSIRCSSEQPIAPEILPISLEAKLFNQELSVNPMVSDEVPVAVSLINAPNSPIGSGRCVSPSDLSRVTCNKSPTLKSPTPSVSPRVSSSRKSLRTSSTVSASQSSLKDYNGPSLDVVSDSVKVGNAKVLSSQARQSSSTPTSHLAASLHRGLEIIGGHHRSSLRHSAFRFSIKPADLPTLLPVVKVDAGIQTLPQENEILEELIYYVCRKCNDKSSQMELGESSDCSHLQLVPVGNSDSLEKVKKQVPKAVEKVLAGAIRREMALEEFCSKQTAEITQLNRLVQQYKHERECNAIIGQTREDKILRLESLMDGVLPTEEFLEEEFMSLRNEHKLLLDKYENHPELFNTKLELQRVRDELEQYKNFFDMGERDVLLEEIQDLRSQLQFYVDSNPALPRKRSSLLKLTHSCEPTSVPTLTTIPESTGESVEEKLEQERLLWTEAESKWISLAEELRTELEANKSEFEKQKRELTSEKKCAQELQEAMQMAMEGHARMLEQYADLEEKHIALLARHRKLQEGIDDVKKAATKAGVKGSESKFINVLASQISALKVDREKERQYLRDENKGLKAQLRDTAEAVQAAGELLVRLKEAEEAVATAEKRAVEAEQESEVARKTIAMLNQCVAESRLPKEALLLPTYDDIDIAKFYQAGENNHEDQKWKEEFEQPSSWFSGYDRCNI